MFCGNVHRLCNIKSDESVSGVISLVNEDGVEIDGRFIKYNFDTYASNYFKPGTYVKLLLDHNGLIVDCSLKNTDFTYGYIKKLGLMKMMKKQSEPG